MPVAQPFQERWCCHYRLRLYSGSSEHPQIRAAQVRLGVYHPDPISLRGKAPCHALDTQRHHYAYSLPGLQGQTWQQAARVFQAREWDSAPHAGLSRDHEKYDV